MALSRGAQRLVAWRKGKGMSQAQACQALGGFQQSILSKLERGERTPTRKASVLLEQVAGIPIAAWDDEPLSELPPVTERDTEIEPIGAPHPIADAPPPGDEDEDAAGVAYVSEEEKTAGAA